MKCTSCGLEFTKGAHFACPGCGKEKIARCLKCKKLSTGYKCKACGFLGP